MKIKLVKSVKHDFVLFSVQDKSIWVSVKELQDFINDKTRDMTLIEAD